MTTPAEQEAERRYPVYPDEVSTLAPGIAERRAFISGAEWSESRYRELLEAAESVLATSIPDSGGYVVLDSLPECVYAEYQPLLRLQRAIRAAAAALEEESGVDA